MPKEKKKITVTKHVTLKKARYRIDAYDGRKREVRTVEYMANEDKAIAFAERLIEDGACGVVVVDTKEQKKNFDGCAVIIYEEGETDDILPSNDYHM